MEKLKFNRLTIVSTITCIALICMMGCETTKHLQDVIKVASGNKIRLPDLPPKKNHEQKQSDNLKERTNYIHLINDFFTE